MLQRRNRNVNFAHALRAMRKASGMTQLQLAQATGITRERICEYETGKRLPRPANLNKLLDVLTPSDMDKDYLQYCREKANTRTA